MLARQLRTATCLPEHPGCRGPKCEELICGGSAVQLIANERKSAIGVSSHCLQGDLLYVLRLSVKVFYYAVHLASAFFPQITISGQLLVFVRPPPHI
jgi:hypothetical protein